MVWGVGVVIGKMDGIPVLVKGVGVDGGVGVGVGVGVGGAGVGVTGCFLGFETADLVGLGVGFTSIDVEEGNGTSVGLSAWLVWSA